jgi:ADP-heptose:LPS heptosyltransferase
VGWGDELMAAGQAQARRADDPQGRRVRILDRHKQVRWHPLWEGNADLVRPGEAGDFLYVLNGPGLRPYIADKTPDRWTWKKFSPTPARIKFTKAEREFARHGAGAILIEPAIKPKASPNKDWGWKRWQALVDLQPDWPWLQVGAPGAARLRGVRFLETADFRQAMAVLSACRTAVLPEGGLHHAAAAVGVPAVVIYGGFISPAQTGYRLHRNLFTGVLPCGERRVCAHCTQAMAAITPQGVIDELNELRALREPEEMIA